MMADGPIAQLGTIEHLLAELHRLDLILLRYAKDIGRMEQAVRAIAPDAQTDPNTALEHHAAYLRESVQAARAAGTRLPLLDLCRNLRLDAVSIGVLMLALAPHIDRHYERVYAWLQNDAGSTLPRVELALAVFAGGPEERLTLRALFAPDAPLLRSGFVRLEAPAGEPSISELARVLWVSPRILRFVSDQAGAEPEVEAARADASLAPPTRSVLDALQRFARVMGATASHGPIGVVQSEDPEAVLSGAADLASQAGVPAVLADLSRPEVARFALDRVVQSVFDEARLCGGLPAIAGFDDLDDSARKTALTAAVDAVAHFDGACLLVTREQLDLHHELQRRPVLTLEASLPDAQERAELWASQLAQRPQTVAELRSIADLYRLGSGQIRDAARMVETLDVAQGPSPQHLRTASQAQSRHGLGQLARRVAPWGSWDDLVLPDLSMTRLRSIVDSMRQRELVFGSWGLRRKVSSYGGVTAMFAGPPGTGKTLSASLLAQALGLELFRIDLASIVSKYIGETEKNLDRVFRAAYRSNAVLFFDEADALFGKRTEVKDAHDRYANVETSYLLQKLESFEGLAVLATNLKRNLDAAFMRRIDVLVDFPFPNVASRLQLWAALMPAEMPRAEDVDLGFLAERFELSGGHIKNAVQASAVAAAAEGAPVGMRHLLHGVQWELQKQGKVLGTAELGKYVSLFKVDGEIESEVIRVSEVSVSRLSRQRS